MGNPLSAGVYATERDLSIVVPKNSASIGAFAGKFLKGPSGVYRLITNASELEDIYGAPTNENYNDFFQAKMFLDKSDKLYISRAVDSNGMYQNSTVSISTAINEPAVGAAGVNTVDITYSETDIIAGSFIRFTQDSNQLRYKVKSFTEGSAPIAQQDFVTVPAGPFNGDTAQSDLIDFGAFAFPSAGGDGFDFIVDGNTISYITLAGDTETEVIAGLKSSFDGFTIAGTWSSTANTITIDTTAVGTANALVTTAGTNTVLTNVNTATDAEVFEVTIDGTSVQATATPGAVDDDIIAYLDADFASSGINNVDFLADYTNHRIEVTSLESGTDGVYSISVGASDTAGSVVTSNEVGTNGTGTLTLDAEINWDGIPGTPGAKQIVTGTNQLAYIYTIATNALAEVKADTGDFTPEVQNLQIDNGTYSIGDTFAVTITEAGHSSANESFTYTVKDDGTGNPENRASVIDGLYTLAITANPVTINVTKDNVIGKIVFTAKYPGSAYAFGSTATYTDVDASGDTATFVVSTTPATDGTTAVTSQELFATRGIYNNQQEFDYEIDDIPFSTTDSKLKFICKWVGDTGNDIDVTIAKGGINSDFNQSTPKDVVLDVTSNGIRTVTTTKTSPILAIEGIPLDSLFDYEPSDDEIAVIVSVKGEIKEQFIVSLDETKKDYNGKSKYIEDVINVKSNYIYVKDNKAVTGLPESSTIVSVQTVVEQYQVSTGQKTGKSVTEVQTGGTLNLMHGDSGIVGQGDLEAAYDVFSSVEDIEVDVLIANESCPKYVAELAETRGDCIAFIGATREQTVGLKTSKIIDNMINYVSSAYGDLNIENSYASFYGNYFYIYDKWSDKMRWVNTAGAVAGLRAETNTDAFGWFASAGLTHGRISGVDKLAFIPNQGARDLMYKNKINPIASFSGKGISVWGQKTMLSRPSSFDRVNVRSLFNVLKRSISKMALNYVFEFNDEYTRKAFTESVIPFLEYVKVNRGIYDFYILCDETNNTPSVIDSNQFKASIAVKAARTAEFILLDFVSVGSGVDFQEIFN